jgi:PKD repeat protein
MRKKGLLLFFTALICFSAFASDAFTVTYGQSSTNERHLVFTLGDFYIDQVTIEGITYSTVAFDHPITTMKKGWAELPFLSSSIQIADDKNVNVTATEVSYFDIQLDHPLLPSRGVIYRNQDPASIPYEIDASSLIDAFYPKSLVSADDPYILRDIRGTNIKVYPFRYNAVQNTLRVYYEIEVSVNDNETPVVNPRTASNAKMLREMDAMYRSLFLNYPSAAKDDLTVSDYGDILVITTERDEDAIQPYIDWKKEKGFNVFKEVVETGTNVKTLVQDSYDANPNILYVQLVGDWADIKCNQGGGANAPMDPMLGCVVGTDWYPEIAVGRFSGSSPAHIGIQVEKAINYEKNTSETTDWYSKSLGVASNEGATNGDDSEMDKEHVQIIYDNKLNPFTYDNHFDVYAPGATSAMVTNALQEGVSIANYCGHGSVNSWVTSGFSNSNISQLTNGDKLPFIFSVACVNGAFHQGECFGEAWLKKEGGGAVLALMATINQPWQPPMRGQDYFNDLLVGGYDYDANPGNGTNTEEGRSFIGSIVVNGLILMYAESSGSADLETIQTWTTFGDCSLQARTAMPAEMTLDNEVVISGVDYSAVLTSDGEPLEGAMIGLSQADGGLFYNAVTDENGAFSIAHELIPGDAKLVVTSMNKETIYNDIVVISPDGPYLIINDFNMNTQDGLVMYNSEAGMDIMIENLGSDPASQVSVSLTSEDEMYCTLLSETTIEMGDIDADETVTLENAFTFSFANDAADQHTVNLTFDIVGSAKEVWQDQISFKINAPNMASEFVLIDDTEGGDGNGRLDAGETAVLKFNGLNIGHAMSPEAVIMIASASPYISFTNASVNLGEIDAQSEAMAEFEVQVSEDAPIGILANLSVDISAGNYSNNMSMMLPLGLVIEDWETGDFEKFDWVMSGNADWEIVEGINVYEGTYSAKSMDIDDNQTAALSIDVSTTMESPVSFFFKVSSEAAYDYLKFYIDDDLKGEWSGNIDWQEASFECPAGEHTLTWEYYKDGYVSSFQDCAWIDYIVLPGAAASAPLFADFEADQTEICDGEIINFTSNSIGEVATYNWTFEGGDPETSEEENPSVLYANAGSYSVSLTISDGNNESTITKETYIIVRNCTGLERMNEFVVEVYPNPNNGQFIVKVNQRAKVEILSTLGYIVYSADLIGTESIDLSEHAEGVYFVKVETETENFVKRVIVRK